MEHEISLVGHDQLGRKRKKRRRKGNERKKRKRERKKKDNGRYFLALFLVVVYMCVCVCVCVCLNLENTLGVYRFMDPCPNDQGRNSSYLVAKILGKDFYLSCDFLTRRAIHAKTEV